MAVGRTSYSILRFTIICGVIVLLAMSVHPFLTAWIGSSTGQYALAKAWKEFVLAALLLVAFAVVLHRKQLLNTVCKDRLNQVIVAYALLHIVLALVFYTSNETEAIVAGLLFNLRFLGIFLLLRLVHALLPADRTAIIKKTTGIFLVSAIVVASLGIVQITILPHDFLMYFGYDGVMTISPYATVDDNIDVLRAFSTQRGPNTLGAFLLLPLALFLINIFKRKNLKFSYAGAAVSVAAILLTYSRSAVLAMLVVIAVAVIIMEREKIRQFLPALLISGGVIVAIIATLVLSVPAVRLYVFHSSPGDSSLVEGSTNDHLRATVDNAKDALAHPIGQGPGSAGPASFYLKDSEPKIAENYFVQIMQEVGLAGLALFIFLSVVIGKRLVTLVSNPEASYLATGLLASFIGINVINILLHGWADDPTAIVWWGFAALIIPYTLTSPVSTSASVRKTVS